MRIDLLGKPASKRSKVRKKFPAHEKQTTNDAASNAKSFMEISLFTRKSRYIFFQNSLIIL